MSSKFGLQIVYNVLTSLSAKPEVVLRLLSKCEELKNDRNNYITGFGMLFCASLPNCTKIGPLSAE